MPSRTRETRTAGAPAAVMAPPSQMPKASMPLPTPSDSQEPKGPKVTANITSMVSRNKGIASTRWVTTASIFSVRVRSPLRSALTTEAAATRWIY